MIDLKKYQIDARSVAIYLQSPSATMIYPALGLVGECGEVSEKVKKLIRDDDNEMSPKRREDIKKELGDVMWYCANVCCDCDLNLCMIHDMRTARITHNIRRLILPRLVLHLNRQASNAAALLETWHYKYRCDPREITRFSDLPNHLTHVVTCVEEMAIKCGFTLEDVCVQNIAKLFSRKARGVLKGDGDNR
jgi:hypothetical protein